MKLEKTRIHQILNRIYTDPAHPAGFGTLHQLYKEINRLFKGHKKITLREVKDWLSTKDAYTLHKRIVRKFKRRKTISRGIDYQWQADLIIMDPIKKENFNYRYILTVIDVFSRYAWAEPLKRKRGENIISAFKKIFKKSKRKPTKLQTDKGTEFLNKDFQQFLSENNIYHFTTDQDPKAALVERFNRTLQERMFEYFTETQTLNYTSVLKNLVTSYNSRPHSVIGIAPSEVNKRNQSDIFEKQYGKYLAKKRKQFKFKYKDAVRITKLKGTFTKGHKQRWIKEHFFIVDRLETNPPTYKLIDQNNNILSGAFYEPELVKIKLKNETD